MPDQEYLLDFFKQVDTDRLGQIPASDFIKALKSGIWGAPYSKETGLFDIVKLKMTSLVIPTSKVSSIQWRDCQVHDGSLWQYFSGTIRQGDSGHAGWIRTKFSSIKGWREKCHSSLSLLSDPKKKNPFLLHLSRLWNSVPICPTCPELPRLTVQSIFKVRSIQRRDC